MSVGGQDGIATFLRKPWYPCFIGSSRGVKVANMRKLV